MTEIVNCRKCNQPFDVTDGDYSVAYAHVDGCTALQQTESDLWNAGYCAGNLLKIGETVCERWYPRQAGQWEPKEWFRDIVLQPVYPPLAVIEHSWQDGKPRPIKAVAIFYTVEELVTWLSTGYGKLSEGGIRVDQGVYD